MIKNDYEVGKTDVQSKQPETDSNFKGLLLQLQLQPQLQLQLQLQLVLVGWNARLHLSI